MDEDRVGDIGDIRQGILGHFKPLLGIFGAKGLFKDTFLFEGRDVSLSLPLDAPLCFIFAYSVFLQKSTLQ